MRQIGAENEDPLKRIQKEINEVAKREKELQSMHMTLNTSDDGMSSSHSDDSGLSISSSPVNGAPANEPIKTRKSGNFGPARLNSTPANGIHQHFNPLMRTMSTPHIFPSSTPSVRRFTTNPVQKGIMQKFIASRGRLAGSNGNQTNNSSPIDINSRPSAFIPFENVSPTQIERDAEGRPIRRGYVPVEEKILKELREMRSREMELKKTRRQSSIRQSQPDFSEMNDEDYESDDEIDTSDYPPPPGKLRATKSIGELCDALTSNSSLSPRDTPSPPLERRSRGGLRPALSLAQLCDLDDEKTAPSSIRLIAQWENLIQKKQEVA